MDSMQGCVKLRNATNCNPEAVFTAMISRMTDWKITDNTTCRCGDIFLTGHLMQTKSPLMQTKEKAKASAYWYIYPALWHALTMHLLQTEMERSRNPA